VVELPNGSYDSPTAAPYEPSPEQFVRDQVDAFERSDGRDNLDVRYGRPIIVIHTVGVRSGKLRKVPLMRVEANGVYAVVASLGGAPHHPAWYHNVIAEPSVIVHDTDGMRAMRAREVHGTEKSVWWDRAVAAFPWYAEYQSSTEREIPVLLLEPVDPSDR